MSAPSPDSLVSRSVTLLTIGGILSSLFSIAVSSILFGFAMLGWAIQSVRLRRWVFRPLPHGKLLVAYAIGFVLSVALSPDPWESAINLKKLLLFAYPFLVVTYLKSRHIEFCVPWIYALLCASAVYSILQYFWLMEVTPINRITGFMSHWMTFSGQLMLGLISLAGLLAFRYRFRIGGLRWWIGPVSVGCWIVMLLALVLTATRNAWLGTAAAFFLMAVAYGYRTLPPLATAAAGWGKGLRLLWGLRWTVAVGAGLLLVYVVLPIEYQERFKAGLDPTDYTTSIRLQLLVTGKNMVLEHPFAGIGPRMVPYFHQQYHNANEFPPEIYMHLHNSYLQVAAESGIATFLFWMGIWAVLWLSQSRMAWRAGGDHDLFSYAISGIAGLTAFLVAGLFEYNFGDSEVLILLLFFVTAPFVVEREREPGRPSSRKNDRAG